MTRERFRCPACGHWCNVADGYGWICDKRGGCGSEWGDMAADDADPHRVLPCGCYADSPMGHTCASGGNWDAVRGA